MLALVLKIAELLFGAFLSGLATSYVEYRFQYSLYQTVFSKLFGKKFS